ncbi:N-formylglutamate deformylase [Piscinibacter sakaiensis]|uniref:N-formylglutamate deformylase n=1 Tax=Piscinibacter sakaiensis TaxID=1547922 RepID=UPI003AAB235D
MNTQQAPSNGEVFTLHQGTAPLLVSLPHIGQLIPDALKPLYVPRALDVEDTDWLLDEVYSFANELGASVLKPRYSRFVIDLNRPPGNAPMYPGVNNTELCPTRFFTGDPLYRDGSAPDAAQIAERVETYWRPYHEALAGELARLKAAHGHAVLWDGHSIKSELPWLFEGRLPELNLGTANGAACAPALRDRLKAVLDGQQDFSQVVDGRFKGGHITRQYGRPSDGLHAVQMEMCWSTYMAEQPPFRTDPARLRKVQPLLRRLLQETLDWTPDGH